MRFCKVVLLVCFFLAPLCSWAGEQNIIAVLQPLRALAGNTYKAVFPDGKTSDTSSFSWVFDGKFLRNIHTITNAQGKAVYSGESIYGWDAKNEQAVYWYWNQTGGFITGTYRFEDDTLVFNGENHAPARQTTKTRSLIRHISGEGYEMVSFFWVDGAWRERFTLQFKRVDE